MRECPAIAQPDKGHRKSRDRSGEWQDNIHDHRDIHHECYCKGGAPRATGHRIMRGRQAQRGGVSVGRTPAQRRCSVCSCSVATVPSQPLDSVTYSHLNGTPELTPPAWRSWRLVRTTPLRSRHTDTRHFRPDAPMGSEASKMPCFALKLSNVLRDMMGTLPPRSNVSYSPYGRVSFSGLRRLKDEQAGGIGRGPPTGRV